MCHSPPIRQRVRLTDVLDLLDVQAERLPDVAEDFVLSISLISQNRQITASLLLSHVALRLSINFVTMTIFTDDSQRNQCSKYQGCNEAANDAVVTTLDKLINT